MNKLIIAASIFLGACGGAVINPSPPTDDASPPPVTEDASPEAGDAGAPDSGSLDASEDTCLPAKEACCPVVGDRTCVHGDLYECGADHRWELLMADALPACPPPSP